MKKYIITIAIVLTACVASFAQNQRNSGGLFQYGWVSDEEYYGADIYGYNRGAGNFGLLLPTTHNTTEDFNAPLGSGALLLIGFGAAYALKKKSSKR